MHKRPRRLRGSVLIRDLCCETIVDKKKLIMPHFVKEENGPREPVKSMPGIDRVYLDDLLRDIESDLKAGIDKIILFGIPGRKDAAGSRAYADDGIIQRDVSAVKKNFSGILLITDVCLCEYTDHGHCGLVSGEKILNDETLSLIAKTALSHVRAGADIIAPSDMMDGRILAVREALDRAGYTEVPILSYAAKYSSAFYGPFRDAAGSAPQFGDRRTYQMDFRNSLEAGKEVLLDIDEGADMVMVKPALCYLDIIQRIKGVVSIPVCAYNVSGEYSMVKAMAEKGWADESGLVREIITAIFRAGADMVISYHTRDIFKNGWI